MGGEELENVCNKNNKAITQEIPPNNTNLPNYADSKIQVLVFTIGNANRHMNSAELSATDIGHSTSMAQTHAAFTDFSEEIKILNYFPLLLIYVTSNF